MPITYLRKKGDILTLYKNTTLFGETFASRLRSLPWLSAYVFCPHQSLVHEDLPDTR